MTRITFGDPGGGVRRRANVGKKRQAEEAHTVLRRERFQFSDEVVLPDVDFPAPAVVTLLFEGKLGLIRAALGDLLGRRRQHLHEPVDELAGAVVFEDVQHVEMDRGGATPKRKERGYGFAQ
jgi:hypothetical protein